MSSSSPLRSKRASRSSATRTRSRASRPSLPAAPSSERRDTDAMSMASAEARAALGSGRPGLVWRRQVADIETPVAAALKLIEPGRGDFLLESVEGGATRGRYTLLGLAPDLMFRADGDRPSINRRWLTDRDA